MYQCSDGPSADFIFDESRKERSVRFENTTKMTKVPAASIGASNARNDRHPLPITRARLMSARIIGLAPAINAATASSPVGPAARLNAPNKHASAAGSSRPVAIDRSTEHHVSSAPRQMMGSGRRPLLNGNHDARNTKAAVQATPGRVMAARPNRGSTSWLMINHDTTPHNKAGNRIHGLATDTWLSRPKAS